MMNVIIDQRCQQIVCQRNGAEVASEVQVDVLHRHHLRIAAACGTAFHAKYRTQRGFTQTDNGFPANVVQCIAQAHGGGGLALAGGRWANRSHEHQFAVRFVFQSIDIVQRHFCLVMAVGLKMIHGNAELLGHFVDSKHVGVLCNFDVGRHVLSQLALSWNP